jgi:hypothetical protein
VRRFPHFQPKIGIVSISAQYLHTNISEILLTTSPHMCIVTIKRTIVNINLTGNTHAQLAINSFAYRSGRFSKLPCSSLMTQNDQDVRHVMQ